MITEIWNSSVPGCFFPILMQHYDDFINYMFWISKAQILANRDGGQPPIPTTPTFPKPQKYTRDKKWNFMQYCICIYNLTVSISHELSLLKIYTVLKLFKWFFYGRPTFSQTDLVGKSKRKVKSQFEFYPFSRCGYLRLVQNEDREFTDQITRIIPFLLVYYMKLMMKHRCYNHTIIDSLIALDTGNTDQEAECMKRSVICMLEA